MAPMAAIVTLREISSATVRDVIALSVRDDQTAFVAPNAVSLAQALFQPEAWYRAVHADDTLVGFVMLFDEGQRRPPPPSPRIALWRFMIDRAHQGRGYGRAALQRVVEHARATGPYGSLQVLCVPGPGSPRPFYLAQGFEDTGRVDDGEQILELPLRP